VCVRASDAAAEAAAASDARTHTHTHTSLVGRRLELSSARRRRGRRLAQVHPSFLYSQFIQPTRPRWPRAALLISVPTLTASLVHASIRLVHSQFTPPDTTQPNPTVELCRVGRCELAISPVDERRRTMPIFELTGRYIATWMPVVPLLQAVHVRCRYFYLACYDLLSSTMHVAPHVGVYVRRWWRFLTSTPDSALHVWLIISPARLYTVSVRYVYRPTDSNAPMAVYLYNCRSFCLGGLYI